jgi:hypothetical protein
MRETLAERVISEVKSRRILWDIKNNSCYCGMLVDKKWSKVAENVGKTNKHFFLNVVVDFLLRNK